MRSLTVDEVGVVAGGDLVCSAGFPSGVKCEGSFSDWKGAVKGAWDFVADIPGTAPWTITKIMER